MSNPIFRLCPVCYGRGIVRAGFYNTTTLDYTTSSIAPEQCRACKGTGVFVFKHIGDITIPDKEIEE